MMGTRRRLRWITLVLALLVTAGCRSVGERADLAYAREDWDTAAALYEEALEGLTEPAEIGAAQERLARARDQGAAQHMQRSRAFEASGDMDAALHEAGAAFELTPTEEVGERIGALRTSMAASLRERAEAALAAGRAEEARDLLEQARDMAPTPDLEQLLRDAQAHLDAAHTLAMVTGQDALRRGDWPAARAAFETAYEDEGDEASAAHIRLVEHLQAADVAAAGGRVGVARRELDAARALGVAPDILDQQVRALIPADYQVTIHAAVVLPVKPQVHWPWDGLRQGAVRDAQVLLGRLGRVSAIEGLVVAKLAATAAEFAGNAFELPDCYPLVSFDGETWGGRRYVRKDDLHPSWDVALVVHGSARDRRVLQVVVLDRDLQDDDTVGTWQVSVGEVLARDGVREFVFVDDEGNLAADGVVALEISVEPL